MDVEDEISTNEEDFPDIKRSKWDNQESDGKESKSFVFATSEQLQEHARKVSRNLVEFSNIAGGKSKNISIRLLPSSAIEKPVENEEKMPDSNMESSKTTATERESFLEKKLEKLIEIQRAQMEESKKTRNELIALKAELDKNKKEMDLCTTTVKKMYLNDVDPVKFNEEEFFKQSNCEIIRNSPVMQYMICENISHRDTDMFSFSPFRNNTSMSQKKKELIEALDYLQQDLEEEAELEDIDQHFINWCSFDWSRLVYRPNRFERDRLRTEMMEKHGLENTVGTVHYLTLGEEEYPDDFKMFYIIVNKRFVDRFPQWEGQDVSKYRLSTNKRCVLIFDGPAQTIHAQINSLKQYSPKMSFKNFSGNYDDTYDEIFFSREYRLATKLPVGEEESEMFVQCLDEEVYKENEKAITWIRNNFKCLRYDGIPSDVFKAAPVLYNVFLDLF